MLIKSPFGPFFIMINVFFLNSTAMLIETEKKQLPNNSVCIDKEKIDSTENIIKNSLAILKNNVVIFENFKKKTRELIANGEEIPTFKKLIKEFEKISPIFLLRECVDSYKGNDCPFKRESHPTIRKTFEDTTAIAIDEILNTNKESLITTQKPCIIVSFGCGNKFPDLIICTKILYKNPGAKLTIHFLDAFDGSYKYFCDLLGKSREIKHKGSITTDNEIPERIKIDALIIEKQCQQFIKCLKKNFPQATIGAYSHSEVDDFLRYCKTNELVPADIIVSADIDNPTDGASVGSKALQNFIKLSVKTAEKNPKAVNFLLAHNWFAKKEGDPKMQIASFSEQYSPKAVAMDNALAKKFNWFSDEPLWITSQAII